jgi:predicted MFS family arabinose efflux permease
MLIRAASLYKRSFTGLSPQSWLLALIMLINRSGTMVVPFMTLYLTGKDMQRSLSEAGLVMGLFGLGSMIGAYFGGKLSDKGGFFRVQLVTLLAGGVMFMILGQIRSFPLICLFTFLLSTVNEAFRPANSSAVAFYSNSANRTRSYSLNRLAINLGWAVGASVGGIIASFNYSLLFWIDGATNLLAAVLLLIFLRPGKRITANEKPEDSGSGGSAYKDKAYLSFIVLSTVFAMAFFQLFTTVPKYFRDNLHLSEQYIGYIMAFNGLIIVVFEMVLVYLLERRDRLLLYISAGVVLCGLGYLSLILPLPAKWGTTLMIVLMTAGEIIAMPFMSAYWTRRASVNNRGQYAALYTISWGAGQTLGPFLCAMLADAYGFTLMFLLVGLALFAAAFGYSRLGGGKITVSAEKTGQ